MAAATFVYHSTFGTCASKTNSASSNKEDPLVISYVVNLFSSSVTSSSCLSSSFLWASNSIRSSLVSSSCWAARNSMKSSYCRSSSTFSLRVTKLLKTSLDSSSTFSNPQKSWANCRQRFFPTPFMVMAVTSQQAKSMFLWPCRCYHPSKIVARLFLIHHSPLLPGEKCDINNIS